MNEEREQICQPSLDLLQGITDLLVETATFTESFFSNHREELSSAELEALQSLKQLAQRGALALEERLHLLLDAHSPQADEAADAELEATISEITLTGQMVSHIIRRCAGADSSESAQFEAIYAAFRLSRSVRRLQNVMSGLACSNERNTDGCRAEDLCLVAAWGQDR